MWIKFNVFGKRMSIQRKNEEWLLFNDSDHGMRARVYDIVIPSELVENELVTYLDDIYHEYSSDRSPKVIKLS